jgi:hypothetical protein
MRKAPAAANKEAAESLCWPLCFGRVCNEVLPHTSLESNLSGDD